MSSVILHNGTVPVSNGRALSNNAFVTDVNDITGETDKTPSEVASSLSDINSALGAAITAKGGTVASDSTLSDKAEEVGSIPMVDPYEKYNEQIRQELHFFSTKAEGRLPFFASNNNAGDVNPLDYVSMRNNKYNLYASHFRTSKMKCLVLGILYCYGNNTFLSCNGIKTIVIAKKNVGHLDTSLAQTDSPIAKGQGYIYTPDLDENGFDLPSQFKEATNWSVFASQIKGFSESPIYNATTEYGISDVCQYKGKFYVYAKEDLQPATGHAPSGTTEDNEYWEYIDNIEVSA